MKKSFLVLMMLAIGIFSSNLNLNSGAAYGDDGIFGILGAYNMGNTLLGPRHTNRGGVGADGMVQPVYTPRPLTPAEALPLSATDHFSPHPLYAYSPHGVEASWTHNWNKQQMNNHPWHGGHNYWRFGTPTALVVPPTAAFHTTYRWGVGQTTSTPIYHQFGTGGAGMIGGGGGFSNTPYWPSSTNQFGVYPVRAPWGGFN